MSVLSKNKFLVILFTHRYNFFVSVAFHNAIPFIGFGFLDNAIMIIAVSTMHQIWDNKCSYGLLFIFWGIARRVSDPISPTNFRKIHGSHFLGDLEILGWSIYRLLCMGSCKNFLSNKRGSCFSQLPNNFTIFYLFLRENT